MNREELKKELESIEKVFSRHRDLSDMFRLEKSYKEELDKRYWELRKLLGYVKQQAIKIYRLIKQGNR